MFHGAKNLIRNSFMPKASEVKKSTAIEHNGRVLMIKDITRSVPQGRAGGSLYRMRLYDVVTGAKVDETFKDVDMLKLADLLRKEVMFSYVDGTEYVFMDIEDYTPYSLDKEMVADEVPFFNDETQGLYLILIGGKPVGIDLPPSVELVVEETDPSVKGASASARTKPARLSTGLTVQVPEYIAVGDRLRINTAEQRFMSRAEIK